MPTVLACHDVKDKDHWFASPRREESFGPLGVAASRTFVVPENPTCVGLVMDVLDLDALAAAMESHAAADAMSTTASCRRPWSSSSRRRLRIELPVVLPAPCLPTCAAGG